MQEICTLRHFQNLYLLLTHNKVVRIRGGITVIRIKLDGVDFLKS